MRVAPAAGKNPAGDVAAAALNWSRVFRRDAR